MARRILPGTAALRSAVGEHLGYSDWIVIDQARVDAFANTTLDTNWIHLDRERATRDSPFGATIAHGFLTLSLTPYFLTQILEVADISMGLNYGVNKVRFPAPVIVGSKIRGAVELQNVTEVAGGVQVTLLITVEAEGNPKPACVTEFLVRYLD